MASLLIRSRSACGMAVLLALLTGASTIIHYELAVDGSLNRRDIALVGVASKPFDSAGVMETRRYVVWIVVSHTDDQPKLHWCPLLKDHVLTESSLSSGIRIEDLAFRRYERAPACTLHQVQVIAGAALIFAKRLKPSLNFLPRTPDHHSSGYDLCGRRLAEVFKWDVERVFQDRLIWLCEIKSKRLNDPYVIYCRNPRAKTFFSGGGLSVGSIHTTFQIIERTNCYADSAERQNNQQPLTKQIKTTFGALLAILVGWTLRWSLSQLNNERNVLFAIVVFVASGCGWLV